MIQEELRPILELIRQKALDMNEIDLSFEHLTTFPDLSIDFLKQHINSPEDLVEKLLEHEMDKVSVIIKAIDIESMNAIDAMLVASQEISKIFQDIFPSVSPQLKIKYPKQYQVQFDRRLHYISEKIKINLNQGIQEKLYRADLSTELIARLYMARIIDIHNTDLFPPEEFSFQVLFNQMFESLVRSIATADGISYFEKQIKTLKT